MDEWANPMFVSALLSSRDGTFSSDKHASFLKDGGKPPALHSPEALTRWDPWVRVNLGTSYLTTKLEYRPDGTNKFIVKCRDASEDVVTMSRPDLPFFQAQLPFVQGWAEIRDERAMEVLAQIDNQFAFIGAVTGLNVPRKKWTMEWLTIAIQFTIAVESMFKHAFACYRPVDLSPQVQPIITTPGHSAYPMGHAAQAFATVVALGGLLKLPEAHATYRQLHLQARRISVNRVVAGVHFPIDAPAGQALGLSLGEFFLCASGLASASCFARTFTPTGAGNDPKNNYLGDDPNDPHGYQKGGAITVNKIPFLEKMFALARAEWDL